MSSSAPKLLGSWMSVLGYPEHHALAKHQLPCFHRPLIPASLPSELELSPSEETSSTNRDTQSPRATLGWQPGSLLVTSYRTQARSIKPPDPLKLDVQT